MFYHKVSENGNLIYGKDKLDDKLIDNVDELKVIKYMKNLRKRGYSYFKISDRLNQRNIKSKNGNQWYGSGVRNVLSYYWNGIPNFGSLNAVIHWSWEA